VETFLQCPDVCSWPAQICSDFDACEPLTAGDEVRDLSHLTLPCAAALADMLDGYRK